MADNKQLIERLQRHVSNYKALTPHRKDCLEIINALEAAEARLNVSLQAEQGAVKRIEELEVQLGFDSKRIEELEAELRATQENEHKLAEFNKPLLARACKAEAEKDESLKLYQQALNESLKKEAENERLRAVYEAAKEYSEADGSVAITRLDEALAKLEKKDG